MFIYLFIYLFIHYLTRVTLFVYRMGFSRHARAPDIDCRDPGSGSGLLSNHKKTSQSCYITTNQRSIQRLKFRLHVETACSSILNETNIKR